MKWGASMSDMPQIMPSTRKKISLYFNGDGDSVYEYRTGSALIEMYTARFGTPDLIAGFSRWTLCDDTIVYMTQTGRINEFFTTMLSLRNISKELHETKHAVCAAKRKEAIDYLNRLLVTDDLELIEIGDQLILHQLDDRSDLVGSGGFANVYRVPGTNMVVKKLKDEFKDNDGIISRFKNEFHLITDTLRGVEGIIEGYEYNHDDISYTMEYCGSDLKQYISGSALDETNRINLILEILEIMRKVHACKVLHRDLSPNNIFIKGGHPIIADFGLGKAIDENGRTYVTIDTSMNGTLEYCDPRQFQGLGFADEQSDIYSLGRIINYVMTGNSDNFKHALSIVSTIATETSLDARYHRVQEMIDKITRLTKNKADAAYTARCKELVANGYYDNTMDEYLLSFDEDNLIKQLNTRPFRKVYTNIVSNVSYNAVMIERFTALHSIFQHPIGHDFSTFDEVSNFCVDILREHKGISSAIKSILGDCIYEITVNVNRWKAQAYFDRYYRLLEPEYVQESIDAAKERKK